MPFVVESDLITAIFGDEDAEDQARRDGFNEAIEGIATGDEWAIEQLKSTLDGDPELIASLVAALTGDAS